MRLSIGKGCLLIQYVSSDCLNISRPNEEPCGTPLLCISMPRSQWNAYQMSNTWGSSDPENTRKRLRRSRQRDKEEWTWHNQTAKDEQLPLSDWCKKHNRETDFEAAAVKSLCRSRGFRRWGSTEWQIEGERERIFRSLKVKIKHSDKRCEMNCF